MARAWHLMSRPQGLPTKDDFALKDFALPPLTDGMVHVRNRWLSVDPYMRGRMNESKSYPPYVDAPDSTSKLYAHDPPPQQSLQMLA